MKLRIKKFTKNKMVTIELETFFFTDQEKRMLEQLGEPVIEIDKTYGSNPVKFKKKVMTGFKAKAKFDASLDSDTDITAGYIEQFLTDVQTQIETKMEQLEDQYNIDLIPSETTVDINY
jgi:hypothetical protein